MKNVRYGSVMLSVMLASAAVPAVSFAAGEQPADPRPTVAAGRAVAADLNVVQEEIEAAAQSIAARAWGNFQISKEVAGATIAALLAGPDPYNTVEEAVTEAKVRIRGAVAAKRTRVGAQREENSRELAAADLRNQMTNESARAHFDGQYARFKAGVVRVANRVDDVVDDLVDDVKDTARAAGRHTHRRTAGFRRHLNAAGRQLVVAVSHLPTGAFVAGAAHGAIVGWNQGDNVHYGNWHRGTNPSAGGKPGRLAAAGRVVHFAGAQLARPGRALHTAWKGALAAQRAKDTHGPGAVNSSMHQVRASLGGRLR